MESKGPQQRCSLIFCFVVCSLTLNYTLENEFYSISRLGESPHYYTCLLSSQGFLLYSPLSCRRGGKEYQYSSYFWPRSGQMVVGLLVFLVDCLVLQSSGKIKNQPCKYDFVQSQLDAHMLLQMLSYHVELSMHTHIVKFTLVICDVWYQFCTSNFAAYVSFSSFLVLKTTEVFSKKQRFWKSQKHSLAILNYSAL